MEEKEKRTQIGINYTNNSCWIESTEDLKECKKVFDEVHKSLIKNNKNIIQIKSDQPRSDYFR